MKNLELVPNGHTFTIDEEKPFLITAQDFQNISRIGVLVYTLLRSVVEGMKKSSLTISDLLCFGLDTGYRNLGTIHPERLPTLIRVDLMVDVCGRWKIAEIDPANKHGTGFALATRYESGAGERQKLLSLLAPYITDDVTIVLGRKETFFRFEQRYLAEKLAEHTGKNVVVVPEEKLAKKLGGGLILDFPFCDNASTELLTRRFMEQPECFINPPRHFLGGKALMTMPYEHAEWLEDAGMSKPEIDELKKYLPPTYLGPFVGKEVFSSGAKGVSFHGVDNRAVFQQYVTQNSFSLGGTEKFIRMACFFVGSSLGELIVSANTVLPVHGGNTAVHYHVNMKKEG